MAICPAVCVKGLRSGREAPPRDSRRARRGRSPGSPCLGGCLRPRRTVRGQAGGRSGRDRGMSATRLGAWSRPSASVHDLRSRLQCVRMSTSGHFARVAGSISLASGRPSRCGRRTGNRRQRRLSEKPRQERLRLGRFGAGCDRLVHGRLEGAARLHPEFEADAPPARKGRGGLTRLTICLD